MGLPSLPMLGRRGQTKDGTSVSGGELLPKPLSMEKISISTFDYILNNTSCSVLCNLKIVIYLILD